MSWDRTMPRTWGWAASTACAQIKGRQRNRCSWLPWIQWPSHTHILYIIYIYIYIYTNTHIYTYVYIYDICIHISNIIEQYEQGMSSRNYVFFTPRWAGSSSNWWLLPAIAKFMSLSQWTQKICVFCAQRYCSFLLPPCAKSRENKCRLAAEQKITPLERRLGQAWHRCAFTHFDSY